MNQAFCTQLEHSTQDSGLNRDTAVNCFLTQHGGGGDNRYEWLI